MFTQFIEGRTADPQALRAHLDRWQEQCAEGAIGWLGTTAGVAPDGTVFIAARFDSAEAAQNNSERPEQSAWWAETENSFEGPASFMDGEDVALFGSGGSDEAGFVQVIRGRVNDVEAGRALFSEEVPEDQRPDVIGGLAAILPDGTYTTVVYFTSEEEARAGEAQEPDEGFAERMGALHDNPPRYIDIADPWMWSP